MSVEQQTAIEDDAGDLPAVVNEQVTEAEDIEAQARRMGWVPKDEFRGDPIRWTDAQFFVERGMNEMPILRERNRTLDRRLEATEKKLSDVNDVLTEVMQFNARAEDRAYKRAKVELEDLRREAVGQADVVAVETIQRQIDELEPPRQAKVAPPSTGAAQVDPIVVDWARQNPWFDRDPELKRVAMGIHEAIGGSMSLADNLAEVRRRVAAAYPERFENQRRSAPSAVASATPTTPRRSNGRSYEDLPPDAKKQCDKFVKQIPGYKREQYVTDYDWS